MKPNIKKILLILISSLFFFANYLHAQDTENTHFINGFIGNPPTQYEFRNVNIRGYIPSFPLESIKEILGEVDFNKINIDYWIYASLDDIETATVEKLELSPITFKNTIKYPLEDGLIGDNCWQSINENGSVLFARHNAVVCITPKNDTSFDPKLIEQSARKIDSVLTKSRSAHSPSGVLAPEISDFEIVRYPKNWVDSFTIKIEATDQDTSNQNIHVRKYGTGYDQYSKTEILTTFLNKNTDSTGVLSPPKIKVWVWNDNHIVSSVNEYVYFMIYPGKYMLTENDLPGYKLTRIKEAGWTIGETQVYYGFEQTWQPNDIEDDLIIYINYIEFENEQKVILGTSYYLGTFSAVSYFGSSSGEIIGNSSFTSDMKKNATSQKWNIAFKVNILRGNPDEKMELLANISNKIINRINDSISNSYIAKDEVLKQSQIREAEYNDLATDANFLLTENNFIEIKTDDTKWVYSEDSLTMGLRKQWANEKSLFSIDIVKLANERDAEKVGRIRDTINFKFNPFCWLNNKDSINQVFERLYWHLHYYPQKFVSATGVIDDYAIFFHYQNEDSVDIEFFKNVLKSFADDGTGINKIKQNNIQIYPNPANETVTIETQNSETTFAELLDSTGRLIKTLPIESGTNTYNISDLESGVYFIQIPEKGDLVVRKIIKN